MSDADDDFRMSGEGDEEVEVEEGGGGGEDEEEEEAKPAKGKAAAKGKSAASSSKGSSTKGSKKTSSPHKRKEAASASSSSSSAPKKAKVIGSEEAAKEELARYMKQQNRPYTALVIYENLHHSIKKPTLIKLCEELTEEGVLQAKDFKKVRLYMAKQSDSDAVTPAELEAIQAKEASLREQIAAQKAANSKLDAQIRALHNEPSEAELATQLASYKKTIDSLNGKLARFKNDATPLTKADVDAAQHAFNEALKAWKTRKRAVEDMIGNMCGDEGDPKELKERLRIETDEENGDKLSEWTPLQKDVKVVKTPIAMAGKKKK